MAKTLGESGIIQDAKKDNIVKPIVLEKRIDEQLQKAGKYEITEDTTFNVDMYLTLYEKRWIIVDKQDGNKDIEKHVIKFRMWSFQEDIDLRKMASSFDSVKRIHYLDNDLLNRLKIQRLLKEWTFEKNNPRLKLLHVNGILSDESYNAFIKLQPNICRHIIDKMNNILEFNG